jgi:ribosomal protein S27E
MNLFNEIERVTYEIYKGHQGKNNMMNTYSIESETCSECNKGGEMIYNDALTAIRCQECGTWFDTDGDIMHDSELTQEVLK